MKKIIVWLFLSVCAHAAIAGSVLPIQHWQLQNGAQVFFVSTHSLPIVDVQVVANAGSVWDKNLSGLALLTNALLNDGALGLSVDDIAEKFDSVGAIYSNGADRTYAMLGFRSLVKPDYLATTLKTFSAVLLHPTFPQDQFKREQEALLGAIMQEQQLPGTVALNRFYAAIYPDSPFAHSPLGNVTSVKRITLQEVQAFYHRYYVGHNVFIAIVGDVSRQQAEQIAAVTVGALPAGNAAPALPPVKDVASAESIHVSFPAEQTNIFIGQVGIAHSNPDFYALQVGNTILGGGMTSLLFKNVRIKRGLVYTVFSMFDPELYRGPFFINLQSRNNQAKDAITVAQTTLADFIRTGPTEEETKLAKQYIIASFPLRLSSNSAMMSMLVTIAQLHLPLNYLDTYRDKIKAVTPAEIKQAFQRNLNPNKMVLVTVGKTK